MLMSTRAHREPPQQRETISSPSSKPLLMRKTIIFQLQLKGAFAARYTDAPAEASAGHPKCGVMPTEGGLKTHLRRVVIDSDVAEAGRMQECPTNAH